MRPMLALALFFTGCHASPAVWSGVQRGMNISTADHALRDEGADVTRSNRSLRVTTRDGSTAVLGFRDGGAWEFISVSSPEVSLAEAQAIRARAAARIGPAPLRFFDVSAEWASGDIFDSHHEIDGIDGSLEAQSGETGAVGIGPPGLAWGMTPAEVQRAIEGEPGSVTNEDVELEFGDLHHRLDARFENGHLAGATYWTTPPLDRAQAAAHIRDLEAKLGPANSVDETEAWTWPARQITIRLIHARGQPTAHVEEMYFDAR